MQRAEGRALGEAFRPLQLGLQDVFVQRNATGGLQSKLLDPAPLGAQGQSHVAWAAVAGQRQAIQVQLLPTQVAALKVEAAGALGCQISAVQAELQASRTDGILGSFRRQPGILDQGRQLRRLTPLDRRQRDFGFAPSVAGDTCQREDTTEALEGRFQAADRWATV